MKNRYNKAEIYLTECTHPNFSHLKYLGLDTKCDPNYLGSSVTLKWFINYLGRSYFKKTVLETISGTMSELCAIEQNYIIDHNAVKDPTFFNMNGGTRNSSVEDKLIDMNYTVRPVAPVAQEYIEKCIEKVRPSLRFFSHSRSQLISRILCMIIYGWTKYDQEQFEYNKYSYYGTCKPEDLQDILSALSNVGIADSGMENIKITEQFMDDLPSDIVHDLFKVQSIY